MSVDLHYEDEARAAGFSSVCGVDEALAADSPSLFTQTAIDNYRRAKGADFFEFASKLMRR